MKKLFIFILFAFFIGVGSISATTVLLMHMEDEGLTDSSGRNHSISIYNNGASRSSAEKKVGEYSAYFNGSGWLDIPFSSDWDLPDDFTIDFWIMPTTSSSFYGIIGNQPVGSTPGSWGIGAGTSYNPYMMVTRNPSTNLHSDTNLPINEWSHVVFVRQNGIITAYINGVDSGSLEYSSMLDNTEDSMTIGRWHPNYGGYLFTGYLDELRIVKGEALISSVPEPATIMALLLAFFSLRILRKRGFFLF